MHPEMIKFLTTTVLEMAIRIASAIAFWLVGRWIIRKVTLMARLAMGRNQFDPTLTRYIGSILGTILNIVLIIGILGYFGVQTTSFAALLAGAGIAIGSAWGGLLSNFAAGAFLMVLRPFKVGDLVTVGGITGTVRELGIFGSTLVGGDNVLTIVGNNKIFSGDIINYSALPVRRVERTALIAHEIDPFEAMERLRSAVVHIGNVAADPLPEVKILDFTASGIVLAVRAYTDAKNFWQVSFDINEMIARVGREAGWPVPATVQVVRNEE